MCAYFTGSRPWIAWREYSQCNGWCRVFFAFSECLQFRDSFVWCTSTLAYAAARLSWGARFSDAATATPILRSSVQPVTFSSTTTATVWLYAFTRAVSNCPFAAVRQWSHCFSSVWWGAASASLRANSPADSVTTSSSTSIESASFRCRSITTSAHKPVCRSDGAREEKRRALLGRSKTTRSYVRYDSSGEFSRHAGKTSKNNAYSTRS